jgi:hypothetical protein
MGVRARSPRSSRQAWRSGTTLSVACVAFAAMALVGPACSGIREDEFDCESAVAHLADCCPGFHAALVYCTYQAPEGCSSGVYPDLSLGQSACIRAESCEALVSSDVCARAEKLLPPDGVVQDAAGYLETPVVCP